jgi:hypothetical protein
MRTRQVLVALVAANLLAVGCWAAISANAIPDFGRDALKLNRKQVIALIKKFAPAPVPGPAGPQGPQGARGADGATGPQGAQGPQGVAGKDGTNGTNGTNGTSGTQGAPGVGVNAIFGSGVDADVTISAPTTLTRDMYYDDLTIASGQTLNPGGFRIFVAGTLTMGTASAIARNGDSAVANSGTGGDGLSQGTLGGSGAGGTCTPSQTAAAGTTNSLGGNGGSGAIGGNNGVAADPAASAGGPQIFDSALAAISGRTLDGDTIQGGAGGGLGANCGGVPGGGGAGGGVVVVAARNLVVSGSCAIRANGGNGTIRSAAGGTQAGGGGGGGVVVLITTVPKPPALTLQAAGGSGAGSGANAGSPGLTRYLN